MELDIESTLSLHFFYEMMSFLPLKLKGLYVTFTLVAVESTGVSILLLAPVPASAKTVT